METLVSVIVPIYNMEKYLNQCLDSIINQTYKNIQIILVNDGSTDHSQEICESYACKDKRIEVINKKNGGLSSARNAGLSHVIGEMVCFIDSDDYVSVTYIENLLATIKALDCDMSICGYYETFENGNLIERCYSRLGVLKKEEVLKSILCTDEIGNVVWNKMYKTELFSDLKFPEGKIYEDVYVFCRIVQLAANIGNSGKITYYYRRRMDSISNSIELDNRKEQWEAINERNLFIKENYPNLVSDCDRNSLKALIVVYNQISKSSKNTEELADFRKKIMEYSNRVACDQKKYRIMTVLIAHVPRLYSQIIYAVSNYKRKKYLKLHKTAR